MHGAACGWRRLQAVHANQLLRHDVHSPPTPKATPVFLAAPAAPLAVAMVRTAVEGRALSAGIVNMCDRLLRKI